MKHKAHFTDNNNNLGTKHSLVMKFGQLCKITKQYFYKKFYKKMAWKLLPQPFLNFQRSLCKKESGEANMLIWTNFDSFAIKYLM